MIIATVGEIIYSPIVSEQRFKIIPKAKEEHIVQLMH